MSTPDNHKLVILIDVTEQMHLTTAKPALLGFLNVFQLGQRFAVVSYAALTHSTFPLSGLEIYDSREVIDDACFAVEGLAERGEDSDMSAAILAGKSLLRRLGDPRAMVMIAGSPWTVGVDPLRVLPDDYPIHTVGYHNQGQVQTLQQIAAQTGGTFHLADDASALFVDLINLIETLGIAQILGQGTRTLGNDKAFGVTGRFADGIDAGTVTVYWEDPRVSYADGNSASRMRTVSVVLTEPGGEVWHGEPVYIGPGFVTFSIPDPTPGTWVVDTTYHGRGEVTVFTTVLQPQQS
ncbi:MAG: vWA domain-containing protein [Acidobacteriota bacterium]